MKHPPHTRALFGALLMAGSIGVASQAYALNIVPSFTPQFLVSTTPNLSASALETLINGTAGWSTGSLSLAFKQDFGGGESGNAAPYYTASITPTSDPSNAVISWDGPLGIVCGDCYLVVKDGNNTPAQYVFNISTWNGTETLNLSGFWANTNGSISNVAIFNNTAPGGGGGTIAAIPEPETYAMLLAGLGLVGFAARRKLS